MADIIETLVELRQPYIEEIMNISMSNLSDVEFRWLPQKNVNRTYYDFWMYRGASGMMCVAHPDSEPPDVTMGDGQLIEVTGFHFKERNKITSSELTEIYQADPVYRKLFMVDKVDWILQRARVRIKSMIWDAFRGNMDIAENGQHYILNYPINSGSVTGSWSNPNADLLGDLESNMTLITDAGATPKWLIMNSKTYSYFKYNNNIVSLITNAGVIRKNEGINAIIEDMGLELVLVDDTYEVKVGNNYVVNKFVKDDEVFIIGDGNYKLGNFVYLVDSNTTTLGRQGKPGFWSEVFYRFDQNPKWVEIVGGFTGIPAIYFPNRIVYIADVTP